MNEEKSSRLRRAFCSCEVKGTREMKTLVVYFSAESGRTAGVAKKMADVIGPASGR